MLVIFFVPIYNSNLFLYRYKSRCLVVDFSEPPVSARNAQEQQYRADLEDALRSGEFSASIVWVISLGRNFEADEDLIHQLIARLQELPVFSYQSRQCTGWAILVYFTWQVSLVRFVSIST